MLILTRKEGQSLRIGDDIIITVTEFQGDKVKIGIDAPKEYRVLREELVQTVESNISSTKNHPKPALLGELAAQLRRRDTIPEES